MYNTISNRRLHHSNAFQWQLATATRQMRTDSEETIRERQFDWFRVNESRKLQAKLDFRVFKMSSVLIERSAKFGDFSDLIWFLSKVWQAL